MVMFARDAQPPFKPLPARRSPLVELGVALLLLPALVLAFLPTPAAAYFDYKGTAASVDDNTADQGQTITIIGMFHNPGGDGDVVAGVGSRTATYYWSTDNTISTGDTILQSTGASNCTQSYAKIQAGATITVEQSCVVPSDATLRATHYVGVCAELVTQEGDKNNNCTAGAAVFVNGPEAPPDYIPVAAPTLGSSNLSPGQTVSVSVGIKNQGDSVAPNNVVFSFRFYYSTDTIITSLDPTLDATGTGACRFDFSDPGVGLTTTETGSCILPSTADRKDYTIFVCIDTDNLYEENFANNCSAGAPVTANRPDWAIILAYFHDSSANPLSTVVAGQSVGLYVQSQSKHLGGATDISGTLTFYLAADASLSIDAVYLGLTLDLTFNSANQFIDTGRFVAIPSSVTPGATYYGGACLSVLAGEVDTANNCLGGAVTIPYTDWQVSSVTISDTTVGAGQTVALSVTVSNAGQSQAGASTLRYYLSTDDALSTSLDTALCATAQPALSGNSSRSVSVDCQLPASLTRGATYYLFACLDAVAGEESSTDNNCSAGIPVAVSATSLDVDENASVDSVDATLVLRVLLLPPSIRESLLAGDASVAGLVVAGFPALAANEAAIVGLAVELGAQGAGSDMDVDQNASVDSVDATLVLRVLLLPGSIRESLLAGDASVAGLAVAGFPALAANEVAIVNRVLGLIGN